MRQQMLDILLVEDNEDDIVFMQEAIEDEDLINIIHIARDGTQALEYLRKEGVFEDRRCPDLVLLDINLPHKSGFQVLDEIKKNPQIAHIPVVMLTTSSRDADIVNSYTKGACSYITKPVGLKKLREVVKQFGFYWAMVSKLPPQVD